MNQKELALEKCEDEFDFFNTNFKKPITKVENKKEVQPNNIQQDTSNVLLLKLFLIILTPPMIFFAAMSGKYMADNIWETAMGNKITIEKTQQSQPVPYFKHIMKTQHKLDKQIIQKN